MSILDRLADADGAFSLEFFPPKKEMPLDSVYGAIEELSVYKPVFASVTYGAGGGDSKRTIEISSYVRSLGVEAIAHLTCVGANEKQTENMLNALETAGIYNILALRGDVPDGISKYKAFKHYKHASDLIKQIKKRGCFTIGAAAYPEAHCEAPSLLADIGNMKLKISAGADFFVTQLCFDENAILNFFDLLCKEGIKTPVSVGIMPVLNPNQIIRMALLSACSIPARLSKIVCLYGNDTESFKKAGIEYAVNQINTLRDNGINKFHLYTMNKAAEIKTLISLSGIANLP
ncbi:MAG: methylenetetrahydrofolate reductase [Christensenellales bacterium]